MEFMSKQTDMSIKMKTVNISCVMSNFLTFNGQEHARDSFENLLFSLCRFYELTGHYPINITVISYELKQKRFQDLHRPAVQFPRQRFQFIGTAVPNSNEEARQVQIQCSDWEWSS